MLCVDLERYPRRTGEDVSFEVLVPGEGGPAIRAEHHLDCRLINNNNNDPSTEVTVNEEVRWLETRTCQRQVERPSHPKKTKTIHSSKHSQRAGCDDIGIARPVEGLVVVERKIRRIDLGWAIVGVGLLGWKGVLKPAGASSCVSAVDPSGSFFCNHAPATPLYQVGDSDDDDKAGSNNVID